MHARREYRNRHREFVKLSSGKPMTILFVGRGSFSQSRLSRTLSLHSVLFFLERVGIFPSSRIDRNAEVDDLSRPETKLCFPVKSNLPICLRFNPIERKKKERKEVESPVKLLEAWLRAIDVLTSYIAFSLPLSSSFFFSKKWISKNQSADLLGTKKRKGNEWGSLAMCGGRDRGIIMVGGVGKVRSKARSSNANNVES